MRPPDPIITAAIAFCVEVERGRDAAYFKTRDALMAATDAARAALPRTEGEAPTRKQRHRGKAPPRFNRKKKEAGNA